MFQVPIRDPTASRMKTAPIAFATPPIAALETAATVWPFLKAMSAANAPLRRSATWSGPSVALTPNSQIVSAINAISTTTGATASTSDGGRGGGAVGSITRDAPGPALGGPGPGDRSGYGFFV